MSRKSPLMGPDDALSVILASVPVLGTDEVDLHDSLDRVVPRDVYAVGDMPQFDNSAMDGFAVIARCTRGATPTSPATLSVVGSKAAGMDSCEHVADGTAVRIMTGAVMPRGGDAVVMFEDALSQDGRVSVFREVAPGTNVRPAGEDVKDGDLVLRSGHKIGPAQLGMLAAMGMTGVSVHVRPRAAIITTGSEIVDASESLPLPGRIRDSNMYSLLGQVIRSGAEVSLQTRVGDDLQELERALLQAAEVSDIVITSGGVSVGDHDLVREALAAVGDLRFWGVAIRPGKPVAFGSIGGKPFVGLPGNPVSSMVTFELFVRPALLRMAGREQVGRAVVQGVLTRHLMHKRGRREYVRCRLIWDGPGYRATPTGDQGSGRLSSMLEADAYAVIPEDMEDIQAGAVVDLMLLD